MPVTVVVGGQYGSEGKGKVAHCLAKEKGAAAAIRVGGPNSGHTVVSPDGHKIIFRQLPTASMLPDVVCMLPAGSYIDKAVLLGEVRLTGLKPNRLLIDPNAVIISDAEKREEASRLLGQRLGSTLTGIGSAVARRINRMGDVCLAHEDPELSPYVRPVSSAARAILDKGRRILIEGTQGYGLSVLHSPYYPFTTARDTSASAFVSEAGLSPLDVDDVVLVVRAFPIRVAGNSGPLPREISWETVTKESGEKHDIAEFTSVTQRLRRVARFDPDIVRQAIVCNRPSCIVLNHLDYVDARLPLGEGSTKAARFLEETESSIGRRIGYIGLSPTSVLYRESVLARNLVG